MGQINENLTRRRHIGAFGSNGRVLLRFAHVLALLVRKAFNITWLWDLMVSQIGSQFTWTIGCGRGISRARPYQGVPNGRGAGARAARGGPGPLQWRVHGIAGSIRQR